MLFNVKIVTKHETCRRVCLVDVIAKCGADAASQAINIAEKATDINTDAGMFVIWNPANGGSK